MIYMEIGKIVGTHGLKGHLKVEPWCDGIETYEYLYDVLKVYIEHRKENGGYDND